LFLVRLGLVRLGEDRFGEFWKSSRLSCEEAESLPAQWVIHGRPIRAGSSRAQTGPPKFRLKVFPLLISKTL